jgi:hypothetical protein
VLFPLLILELPVALVGCSNVLRLPRCAQGAIDARPANVARFERFTALRTGSGRRCRFSQWSADFAIFSREKLGVGWEWPLSKTRPSRLAHAQAAERDEVVEAVGVSALLDGCYVMDFESVASTTALASAAVPAFCHLPHSLPRPRVTELDRLARGSPSPGLLALLRPPAVRAESGPFLPRYHSGGRGG